MPLLERDALLDDLIEALNDAKQGRGSLALLAGEAGSGKTSLVRELRSRLGDATLVMEGACDPLATPRPLSPLVDLAADPAAGLEDLFDTDANIDAFGMVLDRLRHSTRPILLVIEDIHWADNGTLDFLRFVGRRVVDSKAVVLCTYRDDEIAPDHPLRVVLGDLAARQSTRRLHVDALSVEAVSELSKGSKWDAEQLHQLTGGNAFFLTEVLAASTSLPTSVQDAVLARFARLSPDAQKVVGAVSIAPRSLSVDLAIAMSGAEVSDVDLSVAAGVLMESGGELRFRHELARSAVEDALPPARRLADHRRMIALLREEDVTDLARMAHHASRAEDRDLVARFAPLAASEAAKRGSFREAVALYELALRHADKVDPDKEAGWRIELGRALATVDRHADALEQQEMAVEYFRSSDQQVELAKALIAVSSTRWALSELEAGRAAVAEAIEILEPLGDSSELAYAWYCSGYHWMLARQYAKSVGALEKSRHIADSVNDEETALLADYIMATTEIIGGNPRRGIELLEGTYSLAEAKGDHITMIRTLGMLGSGGGEVRHYEAALAALKRGVELCIQYDFDYAVAYDRAWLARIAFEQGRWDEAVNYAEMVIDGPPGRGVISPVTAWGALGRVRVRRGDPGARKALEESLRIGANCEMQHVWSPYCGLAELAWLEGREEEIPAILDGIFRRALSTDSRWARGEVGFWMWKAGEIDSPPENAAEPFALQMSGDWEAAAHSWREIGCPYEEALALADGDQDAMLEAVSILDSLGAAPASQRLRSQLRDIGAEFIPRGPTRETLSNPAGLTRRQMEVLALMADGLTNAEIAERLFISKKTVEHHVSAVLAKLGVKTRAKAIVQAGEMSVEK